MRVPYTVPNYAFEAFRCSEETILLPGELDRTLRSENVTWDEGVIPSSLKTQALITIARNWQANPILDELPTYEDRDRLLELLPLDLPFDLVAMKIPDDHFWERAAEARWRFNDPSAHGESWRRLYYERHLSEYLERLDPAYFESEVSECEKLLELVAEHVHTLELRQLVPLRSQLSSTTTETEQVPLKEPEKHHIPMNFILQRLPFLREISINIGVIYMMDNIESRDFDSLRFSVEDSYKIGQGSKNLAHLTKFSITRSNLDQPRAAALLQGLAVNTNIAEIDFSHCKLGKLGAHAIGAYLSQPFPSSLKVLRLVNNEIGSTGFAGIVHGILLDGALGNNVTTLDFRLNPLGDDAAQHLAALLLRFPTLEYLNVSGCSLGANSGMRIAEVLASGLTNFSNLALDCSNNDLGTIVGEAFELVAKACTSITELDTRMCGFRKESEYFINEIISRNRANRKEAKEKVKRQRKSNDKPQTIPRENLVCPSEFEIYQHPREPVTLKDVGRSGKTPEFDMTSVLSADSDGEENQGDSIPSLPFQFN